MENYKNANLSAGERAQDLLSRMSLEEKMAQTQCVFAMPERWEAMKAICAHGIGEVSTLEVRRFRTKEENAVGFTHVLAPVLDISRDSRMGRQGETYGEDPTLASAMGTAYTKGIQNYPVECLSDGSVQSTEAGGKRYAEAVAKHFMGFHNSEGGIHGAESHTPPRLLQEVYGKPFQAAIREADLRAAFSDMDSPIPHSGMTALPAIKKKPPLTEWYRYRLTSRIPGTVKALRSFSYI